MLTSKIKFNLLNGSQVLQILDYVQYSDNIIFLFFYYYFYYLLFQTSVCNDTSWAALGWELLQKGPAASTTIV